MTPAPLSRWPLQAGRGGPSLFGALGLSLLLHSAALAGLVIFGASARGPLVPPVIAVEIVDSSLLDGDTAPGERNEPPSREELAAEDPRGPLAEPEPPAPPQDLAMPAPPASPEPLAAREAPAAPEPPAPPERPGETDPPVVLQSTAVLAPPLPPEDPPVEATPPIARPRPPMAPSFVVALEQAKQTRSAFPPPPPPAIKPEAANPRPSGAPSRAPPLRPQQAALSPGNLGPPSANPKPAATTSPPGYGHPGLANPAPLYPLRSRQKGEEGQVILRVEVTPAGEARSVVVQRSSGWRRLDHAALSAVRRWRFVAAERYGVKVAGTVDVPVTFRLDD